MLTLFGKFCRKLRIDNGELLKDMADKLDVTASYLSAVENGKRNVPQDWIKKLNNQYSLNMEQYKELKVAAEESKLNHKVDLKELKNEDRNLMMALARNFNELDDADKTQIKNILLKKKR